MIRSFFKVRRTNPKRVAPQRVRIINLQRANPLGTIPTTPLHQPFVLTTNANERMIRRPSTSSLGQSASSPTSVPGSQGSPPSAKRQKTFHTPSSAKPRQTLLKPHQSILNSGKKLGGSTFSSSQGAKGCAGKNGSILSFFKPVSASTEGVVEKRGEVGAKSDDLFIRHGGYGLDVSDPEDGAEECVSWSQELKVVGRPDFVQELSEVEEDFPAQVEVQQTVAELESGESGTDFEESTVLRAENVVRRCTPPPPLQDRTLVHAVASETLPRKPNIPPGLVFDPGSLNLDRGRSILFSKRGSTPSPFRGAKRDQADCCPSPDTQGDGTRIDSERDMAWKSMLERAMAEKEVLLVSTKKHSQVNGEMTTRIDDFEPEGSHRGNSIIIDDFENMEDFDDEIGFEESEDSHPFDPVSGAIERGFLDSDESGSEDIQVIVKPDKGMQCPVCDANIEDLLEQDANTHVNGCLDGKPVPLPAPKPKVQPTAVISPFFSKGVMSSSSKTQNGPRMPSAFTKIMSQNVKSQAWAAAAKLEVESRGKRRAAKTCPFYKILFGGSITVDAFKYGRIPGCQAYFLSHFHSDHYVGLTSKWDHGPIWCSRATANLVRMKLGVDAKHVRELPWEEWTEVVDGIRVRGLDANHCPGSMLFLFEKDSLEGNGKRRILHCGDFRASVEHLNHPLLRPGKDGVKGQKLNLVYLDTTYLNPKYAFPNQKSVIKACETLCVELDKEATDGQGGRVARKATISNGMGRFIQGGETGGKGKGNLLVIVGTYSIGKEKVCLGIAKALGSKIYVTPEKLKICECLEDKELTSRLTTDPKKAQVHMTSMMGIKPETLQDYLNKFKPHFSRIVGLRPSGWSYSPPNNRFTRSPSVNNVLYSESWKSEYKLSEMNPGRWSSPEAKCYSVPYSEHSSFRELTMFCCALNIDSIIPTVNVGSAESRDKMNVWFERWAIEKRKNGLFKIENGEF